MGDLEEFEININNGLDKIQSGIDGLNKKSHNAKQKAFQFIEGQLKHQKTLIESFDLEITQLDQSEQAQYTDQLKQINSRYDKLKREFEFKKSEGTVDLLEERNKSKDPNEMTQMEMIELGDKLQQDGDEALDNIDRMIVEGTDIATNINCELDRQIEKLDEMYATVKDTQSELKRTQKYLKYFAKNLYTDKIILCLIFLVLAGIITLIVLQIMGYNDGKSSKDDQIKDSGDKEDNEEQETERRFLQQQQQYITIEDIINQIFNYF